MNLQDFLSQKHVPFHSLEHSPTYDAQHLAQAVHTSGENVAKSVLLRVDGKYVLAVLQATHQIDLPKVERALGAKKAELATELEIYDQFPDCEIGAIPPFGSQYGLATLVDAPLACDEEIVISGNSVAEAVRMRYSDFATLEKPRVAAFTHHA